MVIGGSRGRAWCMHPSMGPNSFIFAYIFGKKCSHRRSMSPPNSSMSPLQEILDPPLMVLLTGWSNFWGTPVNKYFVFLRSFNKSLFLVVVVFCTLIHFGTKWHHFLKWLFWPESTKIASL